MTRTLGTYLRSSRSRLVAPIVMMFILFVGTLGYLSLHLVKESETVFVQLESRAAELSILISAYGRLQENHNRVMRLVMDLDKRSKQETYLTAQAALDDLRKLQDELRGEGGVPKLHAARTKKLLSEIERYIAAISSVLEYTVFRGEYYQAGALREAVDSMESVHRLLTAALNEDRQAFSSESRLLLLHLSADARKLLLYSLLLLAPLVVASLIYIWRMIGSILRPVGNIIALSNEVVHGQAREARQTDVLTAMTVLEEAVRDLNHYREMRLTTLQAALDSVPMAVHIIDTQGVVEYVNERFLQEWGRRREEIVGSAFPLLTDVPDPLIGNVREALAAGIYKRVEYLAEPRGWRELDISIVRNEKNEVIYCIFLETDITDRKQAEVQIRRLNVELEQKVEERTRQLIETQEELVRKEKLAILGQLSGSVGHELRNPLGVMNNAIYFLQTVLADSDETVREYLGIIKKEIDNSQRIITDLLDFARTKPPQTKAVTARELVTESLGRCVIPENVALRTEIPDALPLLRVDPLQMGQVLQNFVTNAVQAMPDGGALHVAVRRILNSELRIMNSKFKIQNSEFDGDFIEISVADTGVGITPEGMGRLFQPLFTTKPKGIGLGLTVCKNLTEVNGGRIEVESEPGKGTTFAVVLPVEMQ